MNNIFIRVILGTSAFLTLVFSHPNIVSSDNSNDKSIENIAKKITVRVFPDVLGKRGTGSGVIIRKDILGSKTIYLILTNAHVIDFDDKKCDMPKKSNIEVETYDGITHKAVVHERSKTLCENKKDLAIIKFIIENDQQQKSHQYEFANISRSNIVEGDNVYVSGFPCLENKCGSNVKIKTQPGKFMRLTDPQKDGYQLGYNIDTLNGMSGGAVLNSKGKLIGIHGKGMSINTGGNTADDLKIYTLQEAPNEQKNIIKSNAWAIPSSSFLELLPTASNSIDNILSTVYDNQNNIDNRLKNLEEKSINVDRWLPVMSALMLMLLIFIIITMSIVFILLKNKHEPVKNTNKLSAKQELPQAVNTHDE